jgi:hypothetical protein
MNKHETITRVQHWDKDHFCTHYFAEVELTTPNGTTTRLHAMFSDDNPAESLRKAKQFCQDVNSEPEIVQEIYS